MEAIVPIEKARYTSKKGSTIRTSAKPTAIGTYHMKNTIHIHYDTSRKYSSALYFRGKELPKPIRWRWQIFFHAAPNLNPIFFPSRLSVMLFRKPLPIYLPQLSSDKSFNCYLLYANSICAKYSQLLQINVNFSQLLLQQLPYLKGKPLINQSIEIKLKTLLHILYILKRQLPILFFGQFTSLEYSIREALPRPLTPLINWTE